MSSKPPAIPFSFRNWPFYWLARANGRYIAKMEEELGALGLDVPRWRVLMILHEEDCLSVSTLADYAIVKLSTMTRIVQRMQKEGYVICRPRANDGRVTEVLLTPSGRDTSKLAWKAANGVYERAFDAMGDEKKAQLMALLRELAENLV